MFTLDNGKRFLPEMVRDHRAHDVLKVYNPLVTKSVAYWTAEDEQRIAEWEVKYGNSR